MAGCAISWRIIVAVAVDAVTHLKVAHLFNNFHVCHITMTCRTGNSVLNVRSVYKLNVIRKPVNPYPIDGLRVTTFVIEFCNLSCRTVAARPRTVNPAEVMAEQTLGNGRNCCRLVGSHRAMTELTINSCFGDVCRMRERNRLCWAISKAKNGGWRGPPRLQYEITHQCDNQCHTQPNSRNQNLGDSVAVHSEELTLDERFYCAPL